MPNIALTVQVRKVIGRKVKQLRKQGILPANVYGKKIKSQSISLALKDFLKVYSETGETRLIDLQLSDKKMPVLVNNVSYDPVNDSPLHVDFHHVDLKEKVTARVPLLANGEPPAVKEKLGVLLTIINDLEVEALPADLPEKIEVDLTVLKEVGQAVKIKDLKISPRIKLLSDPELEVVKIAPLVSKEAEKMATEQAEKEAAAEIQKAESAEQVTGETPAKTAPPAVTDKPSQDKKAGE